MGVGVGLSQSGGIEGFARIPSLAAQRKRMRTSDQLELGCHAVLQDGTDDKVSYARFDKCEYGLMPRCL